MSSPLEQVSCARLPAEGLSWLAELRCAPDIIVARAGEHFWLRWPAGGDEILERMLAVPGIELFEQRGTTWYRQGEHLPAFDVPAKLDGTLLHQVLFPAPLALTPSSTESSQGKGPAAGRPAPMQLRLVPEELRHPTTALLSELDALARWAENATTAELTALRAARWRSEVLVRGANPPAIEHSKRFWGKRILVPLGLRPEPPLPESALRAALNVTDDQIVLLSPDGADVIAEDLFQPLTRAGLRMAVG